jgi:dihydrofolate synthase/folylpolyglutamate synthase
MLARRGCQATFSLPPDADEPDRKYRAALDWVWSFSARPRSAEEMASQRSVKLERMRGLLGGLGHPEQGLADRSLLVAGTKGKGSTVAMLDACLRSAGLRTARYTSPHLVNWRERTSIDGQPIAVESVVALVEPVRAAVDSLDPALGPPTTFEVGTALSFLYFAQQHVEVAVVEVGTGGRFDATNLLEPLVSVVTPISFDHTPTLGNTLGSIAWHKAGILRAGRPAILAPQLDEARAVVEAEASARGAQLEEVGREWRWHSTEAGMRVESTYADFLPLDTHVGLLGDHQRDNATTAVAALHALGSVDSRFDVRPSAMRAGLANVQWPGRLQILSERPLLVVDGAHNKASADVLRAAVDKDLSWDRLFLVLGLSAGKDTRGVLEALAPRAHAIYLTRSRHERSADPAELLPLARATAPAASVVVHEALPAALEAGMAAAQPNDLVLVSGSLFLVGETLVWWRARSSR